MGDKQSVCQVSLGLDRAKAFNLGFGGVDANRVVGEFADH